MMKKILTLLLVLLMCLSLTACGTKQEETNVSYTAGTYLGVGQGKMGDIKVNVTVNENEITNIELVESNESLGLGDVAFDIVSKEVMANQSLNVDTVAGATLSRIGVLEAIKDAIEQAGGDVKAIQSAPATLKTGEEQTIDTDVVVVGSGAAGLCAAIQAAYNGSKVVVLEKLSYIGGSSRLSSAMVVAGGTKLQEKAGIEDSTQNLIDYWLARGEGNVDEQQVEFVANNINSALDWFCELGVNYMPELILQSGTATINRAHMPANSGRELINKLEEEAAKYDIQILCDTKATELVVDGDKVVGVLADNLGEKVSVNAKAVILATGGYAASQEKLAEYSPRAVGSLYVGCVGATGDGIDMALAAGADTTFKGGYIGWKTVDLLHDHTNPIGAPLYGAQNLIVNEKGERITNEMLDYPFIYEDQVDDASDKFWAIFQTENGETVDLVGNQSSTIAGLELGVEAGVCVKADTLEELAEKTGMTNLVDTVNKFNATIENNETDEFGRDISTMTPVNSGPFYALTWKKALLGTFGGLKVNTNGEVLNANGEAISGLYAAGEVANGDFFPTIYPASGSAMSQAVTFGIAAGKSASEFVK